MKFSIVIPSHRRHRSLVSLIRSIRKQEFEMDDLEIIVVNNLKDIFFEQDEFLREVDGVRSQVLTLGEQSVNRARNLGLKEAKGELSLLLDDDCEIGHPDFLNNCINWHKKNPTALAIGGTYALDENANPLDRAYNCVARQWQALDHFGDYRSSRLVGGNVSYKTSKLHAIDEWFDESIKFGGTEAEFHQRLNDKGHTTLYISSLEVIHRTQLTMDSLVEKAMQQAMGHTRYKIDSGFSEKSSRTYQNKRLLLAREVSSDDESFHKIVHWMNLYDFAYNYTCDHPQTSWRKVFGKVKIWQMQNPVKYKNEVLT